MRATKKTILLLGFLLVFLNVDAQTRKPRGIDSTKIRFKGERVALPQDNTKAISQQFNSYLAEAQNSSNSLDRRQDVLEKAQDLSNKHKDLAKKDNWNTRIKQTAKNIAKGYIKKNEFKVARSIYKDYNLGSTKDIDQAEYNYFINRAYKESSFKTKKNCLLKARAICFDKLKGDCKSSISSLLNEAYRNRINQLLAKASESNRFQTKIDYLEKAHKLSKEDYAPSDLDGKIAQAFKSEYQVILGKARVRGDDLNRKKDYLRAAYKFCKDHSDKLGVSDCSSNIAADVRGLFDLALRNKAYDEAKEICKELPGLGNCEDKIYEQQIEDLKSAANASRSFKDKKEQLLKARDISINELNRSGLSAIEEQLYLVHKNEFTRLLDKAKSSDRDLDDRLEYIEDAENICSSQFAPQVCGSDLSYAKQVVYNSYVENELSKANNSRDYKGALGRLEDLEDLIEDGNLPESKLSEINAARNKVHKKQVNRLLADDDRSFEEKKRDYEEAERINQNHLNNSLNYQIQEWKNVVIANKVNAILYNKRGSFVERLKALDYAETLANQTTTRGRNDLRKRVNNEKFRLIEDQYDYLVNRARNENNFETKVEQYNEALRFCSRYENLLNNYGRCNSLQRERNNTIAVSYRSILESVQGATGRENYNFAKEELLRANNFAEKYPNALSAEMPVTAAYQRLYNELIAKSASYEKSNNFSRARDLLFEAQGLENQYQWITPGTYSINELLVNLDQKEMDYDLNNIQYALRSGGRTFIVLENWQKVFERYSQDNNRYTKQQASKIGNQFNTLFNKGESEIRSAIEKGQFEIANEQLQWFRNIGAVGDQSILPSSFRKASKTLAAFYYSQQLERFANKLQFEGPKNDWISELDQVVNTLNDDALVGDGLKAINNDVRGLYLDIFSGYVQKVLKRLKVNDFNTESDENTIEVYWQNHQNYISQSLFDEGMGSISFLKAYRKAMVEFQNRTYESSVRLFQKSLDFVQYAPGNSRSVTYSDSIRVYRDTAFAYEIDQRAQLIRNSTFENDRIEKFRSLVSFKGGYNIVLNRSRQQLLVNLKDEVFGAKCSRNTRVFFEKLENGEEALQRKQYALAVENYQAAIDIAKETPECDLDYSRAERQVKKYGPAGVFEEKYEQLKAVEREAFSAQGNYKFSEFQNLYRQAFDYYQAEIINKGFGFKMVPYNEKVSNLKNLDFWSFVVVSNANNDNQLYFVSELLQELLKNKSFSAYKLEKFAGDLAEADHKFYRSVRFTVPLERYNLGKLVKSRRYKDFRKAYRKAFNNL